jgi:signal recognition particle subunit SRP54
VRADARVRRGRQGKENESGARIKRFMCMMDSMTTKELDSPNPKIWAETSRIMRIARGCGRHPIEVQELIGAAPP